jgi:ribosomal protein L11 methylase PrmA
VTIARPWERLEESNADAHDLLIAMLDPQSDQHLDVGTGSGALARRASARGCEVVGIDIAEEAVEAARDAVAGATGRCGRSSSSAAAT